MTLNIFYFSPYIQETMKFFFHVEEAIHDCKQDSIILELFTPSLKAYGMNMMHYVASQHAPTAL